MPPIRYVRDDCEVTFAREGESVRVAWRSHPDAAPQSADLAWDAAAISPEWPRLAGDIVATLPDRSSGETLRRIVLRFGDPALAGPDWEDALRPLLRQRAAAEFVVRASRVPPRDGGEDWTLPIRVLHVSEAPGAVRDVVDATFGHHPPDFVQEAARLRHVSPTEIWSWAPSAEWPTAEILHFDEWPELDDGELMDPTPGRPGTLGWIARLSDQAQTRLVVACCDASDMPAMRSLAAALGGRGGPAVLLLPCPPDPGQIGVLYANLVHDRPLDWILREADHGNDFGWVLAVGAGREEALRVSAPLARMRDVARRTREDLGVLKKDLGRSVPVRSPYRGMVRKRATPRPQELEAIRDELGRLDTEWDSWTFESHEGEGLVPGARYLRTLRGMAYGTPPSPDGSVEEPAVQGMADPEEKPRERFVNSGFRRSGVGDAGLVPQDEPLRLGQPYILGVSVGARDEGVATLGLRAILDEQLRLRPEDGGAWIDIGVTGIGFEVEGSLVQELWVPAGADSELAQFVVVPREAPVSVLRFCLYRDQNLVQSFRLAALTAEDGEATAEGRAILARALDVDPADVTVDGWLGRMEYSRVATPDRYASRRARALSLATNDVDGLTVITTRTRRGFEVRYPGDLSPRLADLRTALKRIATPPLPNVPEDQLPYGFRHDGLVNHGSEAVFKAAIQHLAAEGYNLYTQVLPRATREAPELKPLDLVIQAAAMKPDRVVTWSLFYEFRFDPQGAATDDGAWEEPDTCLAALPDEDGVFPVTECGRHRDCLLHHRKRETVACPLGFWGFRHILEIPPQQTRSTATEEADETSASKPALFVAAFNSSLRSYNGHRDGLKALADASNGAAEWRVMETEGHRVVELLDDANLDLIYLYCHARGGVVDPTVREPHLEFVGPGNRPILITAASLASGTPWDHRPLLILNGCGTVGFSPDALSPFLPVLVQDRRAAGLIGTEISVQEELADEVARTFLQHFIKGKSAGEALLLARRKLLGWMNPLGLAYTLYANADLRILQPGPQ